ncbi:MAG: tRNA pseudouridine(55) synthase TruB, partial [Acidobacteria bacterium]|nr:tRNA pseudouridine(55) synthase TruB [Acidobacteriota bacterium]
HLTAEEARRARQGAAVRLTAPPEWEDGSLVRLRDAEGNLIAVGVYRATDRLLRTRVLLVRAEK